MEKIMRRLYTNKHGLDGAANDINDDTQLAEGI